MPFSPGDAKPDGSGRKKGQPNKRNQEIKEYAEKRGVSPAFWCIDVLAGDGEAVGKEAISFQDKQWPVETLMPYLYGKRKPIDSEGNDDGDALLDLLGA